MIVQQERGMGCYLGQSRVWIKYVVWLAFCMFYMHMLAVLLAKAPPAGAEESLHKVKTSRDSKLSESTPQKDVSTVLTRSTSAGLGMDSVQSFADLNQQIDRIQSQANNPLRLGLPSGERAESTAGSMLDAEAEGLLEVTQPKNFNLEIEKAVKVPEEQLERSDRDHSASPQNRLETEKPLVRMNQTDQRSRLLESQREIDPTHNRIVNPIPAMGPQSDMGREESQKTIKSAQSTAEGGISRGQSYDRRGVYHSKRIPYGESFQLSLHGLVWNYTPESPLKSEELQFQRELRASETRFQFEFLQPGNYRLHFSRQLVNTGKSEHYGVEIIAEENPSASEWSDSPRGIAASTEGLGGSQKSQGQNRQLVSDVYQMLENNDLDAAYATLHHWPLSERGELYNSAAKQFFAAKMFAEASDMWQRNLQMEGDLGVESIRGLIQSAIRLDQHKKVLDLLPILVRLLDPHASGHRAVLEIPQKDIAAVYEVLKKIEQQEGKSLPESLRIMDFYKLYAQKYRDKNRSEVLYQMAMHYEVPGVQQDLRQARLLYQKIHLDYPVDKYAFLAKKRLQYLEHHFFYVR